MPAENERKFIDIYLGCVSSECMSKVFDGGHIILGYVVINPVHLQRTLERRCKVVKYVNI